MLACIGFEIEPTAPFGDNNGSIALAQNPCDHQKSKHMQVRYHFIRQKVTEKVLSIRKVDTLRQLADLCTKALTANQHWELTRWVCGLAITSIEAKKRCMVCYTTHFSKRTRDEFEQQNSPRLESTEEYPSSQELSSEGANSEEPSGEEGEAKALKMAMEVDNCPEVEPLVSRSC